MKNGQSAQFTQAPIIKSGAAGRCKICAAQRFLRGCGSYVLVSSSVAMSGARSTKLTGVGQRGLARVDSSSMRSHHFDLQLGTVVAAVEVCRWH